MLLFITRSDIDADIDVDNESISYDPLERLYHRRYMLAIPYEMCLSDTASNVHIDTWLHDLRIQVRQLK